MAPGPKTPPYEHQVRAVAAARGRAAFAQFMEMGTGKSKVDIDETCELFLRGEVDRQVIVAGKGSYGTWTSTELPTHMWDDVVWDSYRWEGRTGARARQEQASFLRTDGQRVLLVLVVNVEALGTSDRAREFVEKFVLGGRCKLTVDESTLVKNHEATRTQFCARIGRLCAVRRIMTGTPITQSPLDLWGQFQVLGGELLGYRSFYAWRARYAILQERQVGSRSIQVPVAYRNLEELTEIVGRHSYRVTKEECLDLPPKVYVYRDVERTPEQVQHYESMRRMALAELRTTDGDALATARNVMSQVSKMHRILLGHVQDDAGVVHRIPSGRAQALLEVCEESGGSSAIVWCAFREDVRVVSEALRGAHGERSVVEYFGDTSPDDRTEAIRRFQAGDARFFVSTLATGCRGTTLTRATLMVYYSSDWDAEHRWQSEDRAHRIGQRSTLTIVDLRVPGTVDEKIVRNLRAKKSIADAITGDDPREWLA